MPPLDITTVQTNTTEAKALLSYDQVVETLGMRIGIEAKLPSNAPGTAVSLEWQVPADDGTPGGVLVHVIVDHNYVAPLAVPAPASDTSATSATASSVTPSVSPAVPPQLPNGLASTIGALSGAPAQSPPSA